MLCYDFPRWTNKWHNFVCQKFLSLYYEKAIFFAVDIAISYSLLTKPLVTNYTTRQPDIGSVFLFSDLFHCRIMDATQLFRPSQSAEMLFHPFPELCLALCHGSSDNLPNLKAWLSLSAASSYIDIVWLNLIKSAKL